MDTASEQVQFEFGFACDVGRKRRDQLNQDAVAIALPSAAEPWYPPLLLVADGLGRYHGGALASQTVVNVFGQSFKQSQHPVDYRTLMERCAHVVHQEIRALGAKDTQYALMGSTVVAAALKTDRLFVLNIGDSRAYILNDKSIRQVSQDHSWAATQVRAGVLTEAEARAHPSRNRLTMAITAKRTKIESYFAEEMLQPHDVVLLCSDGLWGVVPESLIRAVAVELSPQNAADKLIKMANNSKGPDNISVIIARRAGYVEGVSALASQETGP